MCVCVCKSHLSGVGRAVILRREQSSGLLAHVPQGRVVVCAACWPGPGVGGGPCPNVLSSPGPPEPASPLAPPRGAPPQPASANHCIISLAHGALGAGLLQEGSSSWLWALRPTPASAVPSEDPMDGRRPVNLVQWGAGSSQFSVGEDRRWAQRHGPPHVAACGQPASLASAAHGLRRG